MPVPVHPELVACSLALAVRGAGEFKPDWTRPTEQQLPVIKIYNKLIGKGEWEVGRGE